MKKSNSVSGQGNCLKLIVLDKFSKMMNGKMVIIFLDTMKNST